MQTTLPDNAKTWTTEDKSTWGEGPWKDEPDKVQWLDPATGLDCLLHRNRMGVWCGYVGVAEGHPAFHRQYHVVDVSVHGGLTYSDFCQPTTDEAHGICHVPYPGRPDHVWWLGFDCGHAFDLLPQMAAYYRDNPVFDYLRDTDRNHYWTLAEVIEEVTQLAAQLAG